MTAAGAPAAVRPSPSPSARMPGQAAWRLLRLEVRRSAMLWILPVAVALFWFTAYRKAMVLPPLWNVRAMTVQSYALLDFAPLVVGGAAWMGSREGRRGMIDLLAATARPRWARQLAAWAATTCWAMAAYLGCVGVLYAMIARQAPWGGPLWWPAAVGAAGLPALSALGFAAGTLLPSRFTPPVVTVAAFFALGLSTEPIVGSTSYWQISPIVAGAWDIGPDAGVGTFYHYLPDLPIAQVMFLAGLTVAVLGPLGLAAGSGGQWLRRAAAAITAAGLLTAGTAVALAGTGRLDAHGMIAIPALHDAASDRPIRYTPVCSHTAIPVCLNPAYAGYLPAVTAALAPVLGQVAALPGAPVRISQAAPSYRQGPGNSVGRVMGPSMSGRPLVFHLILLDQLMNPAMTTSELAAGVGSSAAAGIVASVTGADAGSGASQAQQAVMMALLRGAGSSGPAGSGSPGPKPAGSGPAGAGPGHIDAPPGTGVPWPSPGTPAYSAALRFAALPASARRAWLVKHLTALRAGQITLEQLP